LKEEQKLNTRAHKGKNNPFYGRKHSEETKCKMSESHRKQWQNLDYRRKVSESLKGRIFSEEWRAKIGKAHKGRKLSEAHKRKISMVQKGKKLSEMTKQKMIEARTGTKHSKEWNENIRNAIKKLWGNPKFKRKMTEAMRGQQFSDEHKRNISKAQKRLWENKEYRITQAQKILKGLRKRPTDLELQFIKVCEKNGLPFKYVGDGDFFIGSKNPDFIHGDGMKICVEVANTYLKHHALDYEQQRKEYSLSSVGIA